MVFNNIQKQGELILAVNSLFAAAIYFGQFHTPIVAKLIVIFENSSKNYNTKFFEHRNGIRMCNVYVLFW